MAFQNQHIEPGVLLGLRTRNDLIPAGERAFIMASLKKSIMDGDIPVKVRNFSAPKKGGSE